MRAKWWAAERQTTDAHHLLVALRRRYSAPEWVLLSEVRDSAGSYSKRTADAVVMNMWPSRGLVMHGFELKVTRSDWLSEMRNPAKSAPVQQFCDRWWLVVSDKNIVQGGELPVTWGLLALHGRYLSCVTPAPKLTPELWNRAFVSSLIHRADSGSSTSHLYREAQEQAYERGVKDAEKRLSYKAKSALESQEHLKDTIVKFEKASGLSLKSWESGEMGEAVKLLIEMRGYGMMGRIASLRRRAEDVRVAANGLDNIANSLESATREMIAPTRVRFDA